MFYHNLSKMIFLCLLGISGCGMPGVEAIKEKLKPQIDQHILALESNAAQDDQSNGAISQLALLESRLDESSGIILINDRLFTHNDSGNAAQLYEIDRSGNILRTIEIADAHNRDWEDIAQDDDFVYIGDIGNNRGDRKDLAIYKITKEDLLNDTLVEAQSIRFAYADQSRFSYENMRTPYDAEALLSFGDNLYIFTKNWDSGTTALYAIPKIPGTYRIAPIEHKNLPFYVTGADYDAASNSVVLCGYKTRTASGATIALIDNFEADHFLDGQITYLGTQDHPRNFRQIEAVTFEGPSKLLITSERVDLPLYGVYESALFEMQIR